MAAFKYGKIFMVTALNAYSQGLSVQESALRSAGRGAVKAEAQNQSPGKSGAMPADTVEISAEAQKRMQAEEAQNAALDEKISYYEQFRPTREGFSSRNLAQGIVDPGAQPFSQNRSFEEVAQAARENMDSKYQQMRDSGEPYGTDNFEGKEWYSLMGDLDRRALYAVASNEGGSFSKEEQDIARNIMLGQQGMAMGLYNGPTRLAGEFTALLPTSNADHLRNYKAGIQFLDQVSIEEKAMSVEWAYQRGSLQYSYELMARGEGVTPQNFDIDHPLVNLILGALETSSGFSRDADVSSKEELLDEPWFEGYGDRLDNVMAQVRDVYGLSE